MKTLITLLIIAASLTSCVKASEFSTLHTDILQDRAEPVKTAQEYININDTLYTSPEAYSISHGGKLTSIIIE